MAVKQGRRHGGNLPVVRWLQVGAAAAGVSVALVAAPGTASADTGTTSSGSGSSQGAESSAGADSSPGNDSGGTATDGDGSPGDASSDSDQDVSAAAEEDAESVQDDLDAISSKSEPTPGEDSPDGLTEQASASTGIDGTAADDDPTASAGSDSNSVDIDASDSAAEVTGGGGQGASSAPANETDGPSEVSSSPSAPAAPDSSDGSTIAADTANTRAAQATQAAQATKPVAFAQSTVSSPVAVADSTSQPDYPEWVNAPVTWRSILTEGLSWLGLGALAPNLPVPQFPTPDLIAGLWVGMRKLHYTFFNSAPRLDPTGYTADPWTGVITGSLGGFDADGDVITYTVTTAPLHGTVQIAEDGTYTYTPGSEFAGAGGTDTFSVVAEDTGAANPRHVQPITDLLAGLNKLLGLPAPDASSATVSLTGIPVLCDAGDGGCATPPASNSPSVTIHNNSDKTVWVYNLTNSGNYSITDPPVVPVSIAKNSSAPVTLAVGTGAAGSPKNRIYIVEADANGNGFTLPVASSGGVDPFNPTAVTEGNSFLNYSFVEYFLYQANGGYEYTIDTSYIDEWSLPIQSKFTIPDGVEWSGAESGHTYGFNDFDTVVSQLTAAGAHMANGGPYKDLVWSGSTPWTPQPPSTVSRIIGPDKVWAQQSTQPASNINMNQAGWVPTSYQDFVQYGATPPSAPTMYPYAYNGNVYSATQDNFDFWRFEVAAPAGTPYPIALRSAAKLNGFAGVDGVWGFFTYPNDEAAGQFTNIPNTVSMDIYVHGSADGVNDSVIEGGKWLYSSTPTRSHADLLKPGRNMLVGTDSTDTFILDYLYKSRRATPLVIAQTQEHDIIAIDKTSLAGAISNNVEIVDCFWPGGIFANYDSQFIYDRSSGLLYYDEHPDWFGYTGILANLSLSQIDPAHAVFVL